mgnify:CR=1 FL=1
MKLNISKDIELFLENLLGKCIAILGIRGSGKSNTAAVIIEELLKHNFPLVIADIDGEYWGLKEKFEILVVGKGENVDIEIDIENADKIAEISIQKGVPVILDLSGFLSEDQQLFLYNYLNRLWDLAGKLRKPYMLVLEEAHEFIPQGIKTDLKEIITRIALRGRKRGLGAVIISQRSAKVEKDVITQAGILFLHRVVHEADLRIYNELLPWKKSEVQEVIPKLKVGECIYISHDMIKKIYIRLRETFHAGYTPSLKPVETPALKQVSKEILEAIKKAGEAEKRKKSKIERLEEEIQKLKSLLAEKDKKINELEDALRTIGYIRIEFPKVLEIQKAIIKTPIPVQVNGKASMEDTLPSEEQDLPAPIKRHIDRIISLINKLSPLEKRILSFLVDRYPNEYSVDRLAAWIGYSEGTLRRNPPLRLVEMGIIERTRRSDGYHYKASLDAFVRREFEKYMPDIGERELQQIRAVLEEKIISLQEV